MAPAKQNRIRHHSTVQRNKTMYPWQTSPHHSNPQRLLQHLLHLQRLRHLYLMSYLPPYRMAFPLNNLQ